MGDPGDIVRIQRAEPRVREIVRRRFGKEHDKPCNRPEVLTCARWECQIADECQARLNSPDQDRSRV